MAQQISLNRTTITSMAYFADVSTLKSMYRLVRARLFLLEMGPFDTPAEEAPVLVVVDPSGTTPSVHELSRWLDSLNETSDSDSTSDEASDDDCDQLEYCLRLFYTLDARVPPTYKAELVDAES